MIARHKGKPMSDTWERTVFDKKIVKKAQENIARIAKKRGITQREFRLNNLKNPSVRLVYNNNPSMAQQDGGWKLWHKLEGTSGYSEFY
jgi:CRISPR/Cas system CSM-associated protein Csm2 small subunit